MNAGEQRELRDELSKPATVTLDTAFEAAMEDRGRTSIRRRKVPKATSLTGYRQSFGNFMRHVGPGTPCDEALTEGVIEDFVDSRRRDGKAEQTINNDLNAISVVSGFAAEQQWIETKPVFARSEHETRVNYLEPAQWEAYCEALDPAYLAHMKFLFGTGARLGESERLQLGAIRMDLTNEARCTIVTGKTKASVRDIFIPPWVARALISHVARHELTGDELVFGQNARRTVQKEHRRAVKASGVVTTWLYTIHDHRHSAAVSWAKSGMALDKIQRQLGHKNIATTMKYATYQPEYSDVAPHFEEVARKFGMDGTPDTCDTSGYRVTPPLSASGGA